jgi:hypothetical protein
MREPQSSPIEQLVIIFSSISNTPIKPNISLTIAVFGWRRVLAGWYRDRPTYEDMSMKLP